jgi:hypothetical protein
MFTLQQPSMALNDVEIAHSKILMWNTWEINQTYSRDHIIGWVAQVARNAPNGKLKNVVINCHGLPAFVGLGPGFDRTHTPMFSAWAGLVEKIWFIACLVGRIPTPAMQAELNTNYPGLLTGDGNIFCSEIARYARCYVVTPTELQRNRGGYSIGQMPTFEGLLLSYGPEGGVTWSQRYSSEWSSNSE